MRVRKEVLKLGKHHAQGGELNATPEWADQKIAQFNRLKSKGIVTPFAWGHHTDALPLNPKARKNEKRFKESKFNAGYLDNFVRDGDTLYVEGDIPAVKRVEPDGSLVHDVELPDGTKVEAAIKEISLGFDTWKDGTGERHEDCLIHAALCTHPIYAGQSGFTVAEENRPPILLSGSTWFGVSDPIVDAGCTRTELASMAEDKEKKAPDDDGKESAKDTKPEKSEKPDDKKPETPEDSQVPAKTVTEQCKEISQYLGLGLPDNLPENAEKALEWIYIAACVKGKPDHNEELTMADLPNSSNGNPMMLSAAMKGDSFAATMAKNLDKTTRETLKSRIKALELRGVKDTKDLLDQVPRLELSVDTEGTVQETHLHKTLTMLEQYLPTRKELASDSELREVSPEDAAKKEAEEKRQADVDKQLEAWGVK